MDTLIANPAAPTATDTSPSRLLRWLPLGGVAYGLLTAAADLVIGDFPDGDTSTVKLASYYATHHAQVGAGGRLMEMGVIALGLFVVALAVRARRSLAVSTLVAVGGAAFVAHEEWSASAYQLLGGIGNEHAVTPAALQAWHLAGSEFGSGATLALFLLGVCLAGAVRALPRWVAWTALVLGIAQLAPAPWGFFATMLTLLWSIAVGIALALKPAR